MSTRPKVYVSRRIPPLFLSELDGLFDLTMHDAETPAIRDDLLEAVRGQDGVVSMLSDGIDDAFLDAAGDHLRVVTNYAVGFDNIDVEACTRHGVVAANTPDVLTAATAELTLTLMLNLVRRVSEGDRLLRAKTPWVWSPTHMVGTTLRGHLLGIVGLGRIGREVARIAEAMGMRIVYTDAAGPAAGVPWRFAGFDEVIQQADVISLHCPLTSDTRHLINEDVLTAMKSTAYLVNASRGAVIDEAALAKALANGEIAGAALDVFEHEPQIDAGLLSCESTVLSPHLGSATDETRDAMGKLCISALKAVLLESTVPVHALNPEVKAAIPRA